MDAGWDQTLISNQTSYRLHYRALTFFNKCLHAALASNLIKYIGS